MFEIDKDKKEFLTVKEFASKLGVHWFTVWRWTAERVSALDKQGLAARF